MVRPRSHRFSERDMTNLPSTIDDNDNSTLPMVLGDQIRFRKVSVISFDFMRTVLARYSVLLS